MPGLDRTGPLGNGALSGRRGGNCGSGIPLRRAFYGDGPIRRGSGMGRFGRGFRWQYIETGLPRWVSTPAMDPPLQTEDKAALKTAALSSVCKGGSIAGVLTHRGSPVSMYCHRKPLPNLPIPDPLRIGPSP